MLGGGAMAQAIAGGILESKTLGSDHIHASILYTILLLYLIPIHENTVVKKNIYARRWCNGTGHSRRHS